MSVVTLPNLKELEQYKALQISITSPETKLDAQQYLLKIDKVSKQLALDVKVLKKPHKDAIDEIDRASKPWQDILAERRAAIDRAIIAYNNKVKAAVDQQNAKVLDKYEAKVAKKEEQAIAARKPIPIVLPPQLLQTPPKTEDVDGAKIITVKRKAWKLPDAFGATPEMCTMQVNLDRRIGIPAEYFILDEARIGKIIRAGGSVPGIDVYEAESLSVRG